jgi:hypothetical protein
MVTLKVNDVDRVLCRLVYCLETKIGREEQLLWEFYKASQNRILPVKEGLLIQKELKLSKQQYHQTLTGLQEKGLLTRNGSIFELNINLSKNKLNQLILNKL